MKKEYKAALGSNIEVKADGDELVLSGYGAIFGNVDSYGDVLVKGAFTKTLSEMKGRIALCLQHDIHNPIAKIIDIHEDEKGLFVEFRVSDSEPAVKQKIKETILKELSIGYTTLRAEMDDKGLRHLKEVKLYEISLVTIAANEEAYIESVKSEEAAKNLSDDFDTLISAERNHKKEYDLLKLKSKVLALMSKFAPDDSTQKPNKPQPTEITIKKINLN